MGDRVPEDLDCEAARIAPDVTDHHPGRPAYVPATLFLCDGRVVGLVYPSSLSSLGHGGALREPDELFLGQRAREVVIIDDPAREHGGP
jgi:hypothetical protein